MNRLTALIPLSIFSCIAREAYRSMIAASLLQARGYRKFSEVAGGFKEISNAGLPTSDFVCQSKMLSA